MHEPLSRLQALAAATVALLLMATAPAQAAGQIEVRWVEPEHFSDVARNVADRDQVLRSLEAHLQQLARRLPDGQTLQLSVTDLNLAGEVEPVGWNQLRILRGRADWPTMALRYTLNGPSGMLRSGEARLADMSYTFRSLRPGGADLGYEKRMIDDWFKAEFLPH